MKAKVIHGRKVGRELGFPTANLIWEDLSFSPEIGVYLVRLKIGANNYHGLLNIGIRPTFGESELSSEVHILDFDGDLYGQVIDVDILKFIRGEQQFKSKEDLIEQIQKDKLFAENYLKTGL